MVGYWILMKDFNTIWRYYHNIRCLYGRRKLYFDYDISYFIFRNKKKQILWIYYIYNKRHFKTFSVFMFDIFLWRGEKNERSNIDNDINNFEISFAKKRNKKNWWKVPVDGYQWEMLNFIHKGIKMHSNLKWQCVSTCSCYGYNFWFIDWIHRPK